MIYVSHLYLYLQCVWYMCSLGVEEVASSEYVVCVWYVWCVCGMCLCGR